MKVIDLLNKITKGEKVPFRIKISNVYYHYEIEDNMYYRDDEDKDEFYTDAMITGFVDLNDEVEIVKSLDNLELLKIFIEEHMGYYTRTLSDANYCESYVNDLNFIVNAINEFMEELKWQRKVSLSLNESFAVSRIDTLINKLQELKGSDKDEK